MASASMESKRKIIKTRAGELGHLSCRDLLVDSKRRYYLVALIVHSYRQVVSDIKSLPSCSLP